MTGQSDRNCTGVRRAMWGSSISSTTCCPSFRRWKNIVPAHSLLMACRKPMPDPVRGPCGRGSVSATGRPPAKRRCRACEHNGSPFCRALANARAWLLADERRATLTDNSASGLCGADDAGARHGLFCGDRDHNLELAARMGPSDPAGCRQLGNL